MKTNPPTRRWFRFSLKTLLIAVTVFGLWLGYYVNWMHQRRAAKTAAEVFFLNDVVMVQNYMGVKRVAPPPNPFPWSLKILGERPAHQVALRGSAEELENQALADRYQKLFPEGQVGIIFKGSSTEPGNEALADRYRKLLPECEIMFADDVGADLALSQAEFKAALAAAAPEDTGTTTK